MWPRGMPRARVPVLSLLTSLWACSLLVARGALGAPADFAFPCLAYPDVCPAGRRRHSGRTPSATAGSLQITGSPGGPGEKAGDGASRR
jgi:hypothetical protein